MKRKPPIARIDPHVGQWITFILSLFCFGMAILVGVGEFARRAQPVSRATEGVGSARSWAGGTSSARSS